MGKHSCGWVLLLGVSGLAWVQPSWAEVKTDLAANQADGSNALDALVSPSVAKIPSIRNLKRSATPLEEWRAQIDTATVQVTQVRVEPLETELEITLETADNKPLLVDASQFRTEGNSLIAEIANAVLALPEGQAFSVENPTADIASLQITQVTDNKIQILVIGNSAPPTTEVVLKTGTLAYVLNPEGELPDEEIVVTGEGQPGYRVPNSSTITRTDTPLRDIPQSIQIIPQAVIRDQRADVSSALLNAPSVRNSAPTNFDSLRVRVRGFFSQSTLDGIKETNGLASNIGPDLTGIERMEVILGPNSVLLGSTSPGGTINFVTKQPLRDPYYFAEATVGSFNFFRGEVDVSGPLDDDQKFLYRVNASYRGQNFFTDLSETRNFVLAPVFSFELGENTFLTIAGTYKALNQDSYNLGLPALGTIFANPNGSIPRSRITNEGQLDVTVGRVGYRLEHQFSENWSLNNTFRYTYVNYEGRNINVGTRLLPDNRTLLRTASYFAPDRYHDYRLSTNVVGKLATGSVEHQLLVGIDLGRLDNSLKLISREGVPIDLFNPVYGLPPGAVTSELDSNTVTDELGFILQDQIAIADNLKLLIRGRFDLFRQTNRDLLADTETTQSGSAFSPQVGIVYQPTPAISLYANYSRSFEPAIGRAFDGSEFSPTRGTQYEIGMKADLNPRLSTTLAFYHITQSNVLTDDPVNVGFSVQTGEQRSQSIELSLAGEILPGWNLLASYAYNDARVTRDNSISVGNRVLQTTPHAASLWTTYEIQQGNLRGLGFGLGLFYVGDRAGDTANSFQVPSYVTTDAAIFYKRDQFRAALNFKNLFNVDYFENAFSRLRVATGAPFTVQGTVSWQF